MSLHAPRASSLNLDIRPYPGDSRPICSQVYGLRLVSKAVDAIEAGLDAGDTKAAVEVLKAVELYGQVKPPSGPVDAELVLWDQAKEWALAELNRKGPSADPLLDILVHATKVARLTRQRMEELT